MRTGWTVAAIVGVVVLAGGSHAGASPIRDGADARGPLDLARAKLTQTARKLELTVSTRGVWRLSDLDRHPQALAQPTRPYLCVETRQIGTASRTCFGAGAGGGRRLVTGRIRDGGRVLSYAAVDAAIERPDRHSVEAAVPFRALGLHPGPYAWRAVSGWNGPGCLSDARRDDACTDAAPSRRLKRERIHEPRAIGCTPRHGTYRSGARSQRRVALTFDDGPSPYTDDVLDVLERRRTKATFFISGQLLASRGALLRRMIRDGHEIASHGVNHDRTPSRAQLARVNAQVRQTSGFEPCAFRPPGGTISRSIEAARALGMATVLWDVDPQDWTNPGSRAIYSRVVGNVQPGSIVLLHDGGGNRAATVAALPAIIDTLRHRGYRLVTVSRVLGGRTILGPRAG